LNTLSGFEMDVFVVDVFDRGVECLMPTALAIIHILANYPPIVEVKNLFSQNLIGLLQSVKDKSVEW
jgi:hypothetical protein